MSCHAIRQNLKFECIHCSVGSVFVVIPIANVIAIELTLLSY